ncbi:MAG TPA: 4Fe-4S binding protein [Thermoleophilia bacterium]|nr:4Fe-4S binding protein [Thermoleophilia bacterium]
MDAKIMAGVPTGAVLPAEVATAGEQGRPSRGRPRGYQLLRFVIQAAVLLYVILAAIGHSVSWSWTANLHTICPFGGVENLYTYFTTGNYVAKLHDAVFVLLLGLVAGLILTGKSFCGWICPLGTVQELLGKVSRFVRRGRPSVVLPRQLDRVLSYGKYAVLAWVLVQTARTGRLAFEGYDPYYTLFNIWSDEIAWTGYLVVGITLGLSLFLERPFCRYACPLGAVNGIFNKFSLLTLRRDPATCIDCGRCDRACPANISVSTGTVVADGECTRCLKCVEACPVNAKGADTLRVRSLFGRVAKRGASLPVPAFYSMAILAFALPILITNLTGDFKTEATHVYTSAADIKGSSPLGDIVENFGVSKAELYRGFAIPDEVPLKTKLKDVQGQMSLAEGAEIVVPENVRTAIGALDEPVNTLTDEADVPPERIESVLRDAGLRQDATIRQLMQEGTPGAVAYVLSGEWPTPVQTDGGVAPPVTSTTSVGTGTEGAEGSPESPTGGGTGYSDGEETPPAVRGTTTLGEMKDLVDDFPAFLVEFGIPASEPSSAQLKDLVGTYGLEVSEVRAYVEAQ